MTVADLIRRMRIVGIDYDEKHVLDEELRLEILDIEREVLSLILDFGVSSYPIPGDTLSDVDVSTYNTSYPLPLDAWRVRRVNLETPQTGPRGITVQLVTPEHAGAVPYIHPSAYIEDGEIWPVDGVVDGEASSRGWGWQNATNLAIRHIPAPEPKDTDDVLSIPDDSIQLAALKLARFVAKRGRSSDSTVSQVQRDMERAETMLRASVQNYLGAGYRSG